MQAYFLSLYLCHIYLCQGPISLAQVTLLNAAILLRNIAAFTRFGVRPVIGVQNLDQMGISGVAGFLPSIDESSTIDANLLPVSCANMLPDLFQILSIQFNAFYEELSLFLGPSGALFSRCWHLLVFLLLFTRFAISSILQSRLEKCLWKWSHLNWWCW